MTITPAPVDSAASFAVWRDYFERNRVRRRRMDDAIPQVAPCALVARDRAAVARSLQRFELGESGEGAHLLALADRTGDADYRRAVRVLVEEEQAHSALFRRGLQHLGAPSLDGHWSDAAFTTLRRALGLDTEIALFLIAETVALDWFEALAESPDPVLAGIGRRIVADEREHVRFQVDRLHRDLGGRPALVRILIAAAWSIAAVGAATVLAVGHADALRACGRTPSAVWVLGLRTFAGAAREALIGHEGRLLGPSVPRPDLLDPHPAEA